MNEVKIKDTIHRVFQREDLPDMIRLSVDLTREELWIAAEMLADMQRGSIPAALVHHKGAFTVYRSTSGYIHAIKH